MLRIKSLRTENNFSQRGACRKDRIQPKGGRLLGKRKVGTDRKIYLRACRLFRLFRRLSVGARRRLRQRKREQRFDRTGKFTAFRLPPIERKRQRSRRTLFGISAFAGRFPLKQPFSLKEKGLFIIVRNRFLFCRWSHVR